MPGTTKLSVTGFLTSMVTAAAKTSRRPTWAGESLASSRARTRTRAVVAGVVDSDGTSP